MRKTVMVIGDPHYGEGQSPLRFHAAHNMGRELGVDHVCIMGDMVNMDPLSAFEQVGSRVMEGQRVQREVELGYEAIDLIVGSAVEADDGPLFHFIEGNHEYRLNRWMDNDVRFSGLVNLEREWGPLVHTYTPYRKYLEIDGVYFTHIPHNKGRPISGSGMSVSVAQKVAAMADVSTVFGHTHVLDLGRTVRNGTERIIYALSAGCFFEQEYNPHYVQDLPLDWWRGIVVLEIEHGEFDMSTFSLDRVKALYL